MRIHIGEGDRRGGKPLYMDIIQLLRARKLAGATVFRGTIGLRARPKSTEDYKLPASAVLSSSRRRRLSMAAS
jgi:PII-like signaling protein